MELWRLTEQLSRLILSSLIIYIGDDFNIHHEEWLVNSNKNDDEGKYCHDFSIASDPTQITDKLNRVPDINGRQVNCDRLALVFAC